MRKGSLILLISLVWGYLHACNVHLIGDSHSYFCFTNLGIPARVHDESSVFTYYKGMPITIPFYFHTFPGRTMFRVGRDGLDIKNYGIQKDDVIVFMFGEVDVRLHIGRQRDQKNRNECEVIDTLADSFIKAVKKTLTEQQIGIVVSIIPPTDCPFAIYQPYGSLQERVRICSLLNNRLRTGCAHQGIFFLDIHPMFALQNGSLNLALSDGSVHISPAHNSSIKNKLAELIFDIRKGSIEQ